MEIYAKQKIRWTKYKKNTPNLELYIKVFIGHSNYGRLAHVET